MNYLLINATKMQAVAIGASFFKYEFHLNDAKVETQATHKILGVVVGSELTFRRTYGEQLTKHGQSFRVAERLRKFISKDVMVRFYKTYVLS